MTIATRDGQIVLGCDECGDELPFPSWWEFEDCKHLVIKYFGWRHYANGLNSGYICDVCQAKRRLNNGKVDGGA